MPTESIQAAASAYAYPLLIKQLLHTPLATAADQEIVYRDSHRQTYRDLAARIRRLANSLRDAGVGPGDTVAVMDWDSHRYLECFFAVPMMGAVLQTVNVRLSPEQIAYTLQHARAEVLLVHHEFLQMLAGIRERFEVTTVEAGAVREVGHARQRALAPRCFQATRASLREPARHPQA